MLPTARWVAQRGSRASGRGIATRSTGRRDSSASGYGFSLFLLTPHPKRIQKAPLRSHAVTSPKVSGTFLLYGLTMSASTHSSLGSGDLERNVILEVIALPYDSAYCR